MEQKQANYYWEKNDFMKKSKSTSLIDCAKTTVILHDGKKGGRKTAYSQTSRFSTGTFITEG